MLVVPLRLEDEGGAPTGAPRPTPTTWSAVAAIAAVFLLELLARASLDRGWAFPGEALVRAVLGFSASAKLYAEPDLFAPWQLWSYALLHAGWWHVLANVATLIVVGRAVERWLGPATFAMLLLLLVPLAGFVHLRHAGAAPLLGASGAIAGVAALAWALAPRQHVRWAFVYYLVVVVGWIPFRLPLRVVVLLFVLQDLLRMVVWRASGPVASDVLLVGLLAGFALGKLVGRLQARAA